MSRARLGVLTLDRVVHKPGFHSGRYRSQVAGSDLNSELIALYAMRLKGKMGERGKTKGDKKERARKIKKAIKKDGWLVIANLLFRLCVQFVSKTTALLRVNS